MDKYDEAENRLAELLWPEAYIAIAHQNAREHRWCRNWETCGPLLASHIDYLALPTLTGGIIAEILGEDAADHTACLVDTKDHPDRDTAVRYAIVQAVIAKLSTQQEP